LGRRAGGEGAGGSWFARVVSSWGRRTPPAFAVAGQARAIQRHTRGHYFRHPVSTGRPSLKKVIHWHGGLFAGRAAAAGATRRRHPRGPRGGLAGHRSSFSWRLAVPVFLPSPGLRAGAAHGEWLLGSRRALAGSSIQQGRIPQYEQVAALSIRPLTVKRVLHSCRGGGLRCCCGWTAVAWRRAGRTAAAGRGKNSVNRGLGFGSRVRRPAAPGAPNPGDARGAVVGPGHCRARSKPAEWDQKAWGTLARATWWMLGLWRRAGALNVKVGGGGPWHDEHVQVFRGQGRGVCGSAGFLTAPDRPTDQPQPGRLSGTGDRRTCWRWLAVGGEDEYHGAPA